MLVHGALDDGRHAAGDPGKVDDLDALLVELEAQEAVHGLAIVELLDELVQAALARPDQLQAVAVLCVREQEPVERRVALVEVGNGLRDLGVRQVQRIARDRRVALVLPGC